MLDIKFIRKNLKEVEEAIKRRRVDVNLKHLLDLDDKRLELIKTTENLRHERKQVAEKKDIKAGKKIKSKLNKSEDVLREVEQQFEEYLEQVPNLLSKDVPDGKDEGDNEQIRSWGKKTKFKFEPKDHIQIGKNLGIIDEERAAKVSGHGFYFLIDEGAMLELALINWATHFLVKKGYIPVITPELVRKKFVEGTGYLPRREKPDIYKIEGEDLYLAATAEIPLAGLHADEILAEQDLPTSYVGFSTSFRRESGSYGKYAKGMFRVHQFDKLEMFKIVKPEDSDAAFKEIVSLEEQIFQALEIPYRVVNVCSADMSAPAYLKYDLEYWSPADQTYREFTSASNTTEFQARRLNIKYRKKDGTTAFVSTLNGTAVAISRTLIAILENCQQKDGSVKIPKVLHEYLRKDIIQRQK